MRYVFALLILVAGCGGSPEAPSSVAGAWLLEIVASDCPDGLPDILEMGTPEVIDVGQTGAQVAAQFVDGDGNACTLAGTYEPNVFKGTLTIAGGARTIVAVVDGYARVEAGRRQVDGWMRVETDTGADCEGAIVEFCAIIGVEAPPTGGDNQPPTLSLVSADPACAPAGSTVAIAYTSNDPDSVATITFYADRDGELATTDDQVLIAQGVPDANGRTETVTWDTDDTPVSDYTLLAVATDGEFTAEAALPVTIVSNAPLRLDHAVGIQGSIDGRAIDTFADGSYVVVGRFFDTVVLGAGEANETTLVSAGFEDAFVARFNSDGTLRWARRGGGPGQGFDGEGDAADGVATFADGSCVVIGRFNGDAVFGEGEANETTLVTAGADETFVARYDANGNLVWAKQDLDPGTNEGWTVGTFPDGTCIVGARFFNSVTWGVGEANETQLAADGQFDIAIAKLAADGSLLWARRYGGPGRERPHACATSADGTFVMTGQWGDGDVDFGTGPISPVDDDELWIARFDADGNIIWFEVATGPGEDEGRDVVLLPDGSIVMSGEFEDEITFGATTLVSAGRDDVMLVRYAADGTRLWAIRDGGPDRERLKKISVMPDGSILGVGEMDGVARLGTTTLVSYGDDDLLYVNYSAAGELNWAHRDGGSDEDNARDIAAFPDGSFVVTGGTDAGPVTFGLCDPLLVDGDLLNVRYEVDFPDE